MKAGKLVVVGLVGAINQEDGAEALRERSSGRSTRSVLEFSETFFIFQQMTRNSSPSVLSMAMIASEA